jgi:hypothetical protein
VANLNITEIYYHPAEPATPAELAVSTNQDEFEFIEIANVWYFDINQCHDSILSK